MRIKGGLVVFIILALLSINSFAEAKDNNSNESAIKEAVTNYLSGIDNRDTKTVENLLASTADVITVNTVTNKTNEFSHDDMILQLQKGQLGGWKRDVSFASIDYNNNTAVVKVEVTDQKLLRTSYISLVNEEGQWKIVSDVSSIAVK
ncbi:MAG TPA: nuclear transport factor 2 family protein [Ignavibacteriaceae bacterium]|nr:nuclear transport factor 2 family protein [Ignavibacteriaceae bacterium]